MNEWKLFCRNRQVKRERKEHDKQISILRTELWRYIKNLAIFFNKDENLSIYNVIKRSQMDDKKFLLQILIVNTWFGFFYDRFHDIQDLAKLREELVSIIRWWEQIYKEFGKELKEENLDKLWLSFENEYNGIIGQLNMLLQKIAPEREFLLQKFHLLCDNPKEDPFIEE
ncbi:MAG: hypothetical protein COT45_03205 [bacterium (Candidatus Stahlbacteria) CG08_land_8_20_14_0_20_40_26]|nr:MAG: hypothetical protein COX49_09395 [bacterium (Candidatus Stahlbacteria) CG23_combo_of_CG06-09_8_20_14_all_40_9]PIS24997.1 MAG: hypothetical protein COT45_03205 [bacterium (Candidatus Stahlbacteria) CG08_land_8_20_14_0_20_40_26]